MFNKFLYLMILSYSFLMGSALLVAAPNDGFDPGFESQMDQAIQKAEADVQDKYNQATRMDNVPRWDTKLALENAIINLEVKKTLVNNFRGTSSLKSALVRNRLLEILNESSISEGDLAGLLNLVNQEKAKMNQAEVTPISPNVHQPLPNTPISPGNLRPLPNTPITPGNPKPLLPTTPKE